MDLAYCHGNQYEVISTLKVFPNNRIAKIFLVCLHYEISFFGIFHQFTNTIATKNPLRASLRVKVGQGGSGIPVYPKKIRQNTQKYPKYMEALYTVYLKFKESDIPNTRIWLVVSR